MDEIYKQLAHHLNTLPIPFPSTESGLELRVLELFFNREEAEIALQMSGNAEPASSVAQRLNRNEEETAAILEDMSKKGLLFRTSKGGRKKFNLVPFMEGLWEFRVNLMNREEAVIVNEYIEQFMTKAWFATETSQHRVIPLDVSLSQDVEIMQYDKAESIIKAQTKIVVTKCPCRRHQIMIGKGCDNPLEVCLAFGTGAYYFLENGWGREIDQAEALQLLEKGKELGLVFQPGNGQKSWSLCMCCACCCVELRALKSMSNPADAAHSNFYAECDEDHCTLCGDCEEICPMEAISLEDEIIIDLSRCIGCGVCESKCPEEAMHMKRKDQPDLYSPPENMVAMQERILNERRLKEEPHK